MTKEELKKHIDDLCKENKLVIRYRLNFPIYRIIPDDVKLAMNVLEKHGMTISLEIEDKR